MENNTLEMNQLKIIQTRNIARKIRERLVEEKLKDTTLNNLIKECQLKSDEFFSALDWLAKNNKIFFLVTPKETYVLPVG